MSYDHSVLFFHPTGNANSTHAALGLWHARLLHSVVTSFNYLPAASGRGVSSLLPAKLSARIEAELGRRAWLPSGVGPVHSYPFREYLRILAMRLGIARALGMDSFSMIAWVQDHLERRVAEKHAGEEGVRAVYAYADRALLPFQRAKERGARCFYDLPAQYHAFVRALLEEEQERFPEMREFLTATSKRARREEKNEKELELADHVLVASTATARSLAGSPVPPERISVIPYGAPVDYFAPAAQPPKRFTVLYVGNCSYRKGIHYLLQAWKELSFRDAELLLVGPWQLPRSYLALGSVRNIPSLPHRELSEIYRHASVFVFPTLADGFGLVLLEAMASGVPVIATTNSGAPDIVTEGGDGFLIGIRDVEILKERLQWCYEHQDEAAEMGRFARRTAEKLQWGIYEQRIGERVADLLV